MQRKQNSSQAVLTVTTQIMFSIVDRSGKSRQDGNPIAWKAKA
jgi:hypothetical protein